MRKLFLIVLLLLSTAVSAEVVTRNTYNISDDGYASVPLPFAFPFYGQVFTQSYMFSNGVVGFQSPRTGFCCSGYDISNPNNTFLNYSIMPLQTDLIGHSDTVFATESTSNWMKYSWENVYEYGTNNANTFNVEIDAAGLIAMQYSAINVQNHSVTIGITGDVSLGEYNSILNAGSPNSFANSALFPTQNISQCYTNPLSDPSCPGYATAYLSLQCSTNTLYSPSCPGYAQAYFDQQCSLDPLYNSSCPGYAVAYLDYQCSLDPLYATQCTGYAEAYFNQQCSLNPLYDSQCTGYAVAYFDQQCSLDPLYNNQCPGYAEAYALANIVNTTPTQTTTTTVVTTSPAEVAVVSDPIVNEVVTSTTTSVNSADATAPVQLVTTAPAATTETATTTESTSTASTEETAKEEEVASNDTTSSSSETTTNTASQSSTEGKKPETKRQQLAAARKEAAQKAAAKAGAQAAEDLNTAKSMESQIAVQNVVLAAMGYSPGFDAYKSFIMPDGVGYKPFAIYKNQKNVDNRRLSRGLTGPSDNLHEQMVAAQWELK